MKYAIALLLCLSATPVKAETFNIPCGPYDSAVKQLAEKYDERMREGGVTTGGQGILEIWASPNGETWTVIVHGADGRSCLLAAGTDWGAIRPKDEPSL